MIMLLKAHRSAYFLALLGTIAGCTFFQKKLTKNGEIVFNESSIVWGYHEWRCETSQCREGILLVNGIDIIPNISSGVDGIQVLEVIQVCEVMGHLIVVLQETTENFAPSHVVILDKNFRLIQAFEGFKVNLKCELQDSASVKIIGKDAFQDIKLNSLTISFANGKFQRKKDGLGRSNGDLD